MSLPDISALTVDELATLQQNANILWNQKILAEQQEQANHRTEAVNAITALENLLGPTNAPAGVGSIRAVRKYDAATMGANAGIALNLAFQALEILTTTTLSLAKVVAADQ